MSIQSQVKALEAKRDRICREIDAELAKLRVLCDHKNSKSHYARPGDDSNECLDCGRWY